MKLIVISTKNYTRYDHDVFKDGSSTGCWFLVFRRLSIYSSFFASWFGPHEVTSSENDKSDMSWFYLVISSVEFQF